MWSDSTTEWMYIFCSLAGVTYPLLDIQHSYPTTI